MSNASGTAGGSTQEPASPSLPSLDLAFDLTREQLAAQLAHAETLTTRANFVLGSASLLIAAATALHSTIEGHPLGVGAKILATLAVLVYLFVVYASFKAYSLRTFVVVPDPVVLQEVYVGVDLERTKGDLLTEMVNAYKENKQVIKEKVNWTKIALATLSGEVVILAVLALAQLYVA